MKAPLLAHRREPYRQVLALAWPITLAMFGETAIGLVDTKLVSGLGPTALAAVGVGNSLYMLVFVTVLGFMRAVKVSTSYAVGAGHAASTGRTAEVGAILGALMGLAGALVLQGGGVLLPAIGIRHEVVGPASQFLAVRALGLPASCAVAALLEHRQGLGQAWGVTATLVMGNVVNAVAAYALIHGVAGLPALGVRGAGIGASLSDLVQVIIATSWLVWQGARGLWRRAPFMGVARELAALGLPTALHFGCEFLALVAFTSVLGSLAEAEIAANQVAVAINRTAFLPGIAFGEATCVLVGQALGRGDPAACRASVRAALVLALAFMAACALTFLLLGSVLADAFSTTPTVRATVIRLLRVAALFQLLDAVDVVMRGALRGARDVRWAATVGIITLWAFVPTSAVVLGRWANMGVLGGWMGFLVATALSAVLFTRRWRRLILAAEQGGGPPGALSPPRQA